MQKKIRNCKYCGNTCNSSTAIYCSLKCQNDYQQEKYIEDWLSGKISGTIGKKYIRPSHRIKRYFMEKNGNRCSKCGWGEKHPDSGVVPLHLDHIDGNHKNNSPDNLRLLCPNCHSLTENFGSRNKNGRGWVWYKKDEESN